ncbi:MAG: hypothetical protein ACRDY4_08715, partial [Acidimicrobiia bacterium]
RSNVTVGGAVVATAIDTIPPGSFDEERLMRGHRRQRAVALGACALAAAVAVVGAGFPSGAVPPDEWVESLCTSLTTWRDDLTRARTDNEVTEGGLDERRDAVVSYLRQVTRDTDALLKRLERDGTPGVPDGKAVARAFRRGFRQARAAFADARKEVENLDTDRRRKFENALEDIRDDITEGAEAVDETFDDASERYDVEALDDAFDAEPACAGIS